MNTMLDQVVKDLVLQSPRPAAVVSVLADLGITPRYATWPLRAAADALGLSYTDVERRLDMAIPSGTA
jgi:hypothetical protein